MPLALDVLSDILSEPTFDRDELVREQSVIVQEIGAVADTPDDLIFEHLNEIAFPDQPLGRSILGTPATVRSFDGGKLRDYLAGIIARQTSWSPLPGPSTMQPCSPRLRSALRGFNGPASPMPEPAKFGGGSHVEKRELEQVHIALALPGIAVTDPALYSLQVFANILGGGMSSRLFQEAREKRGLCYSIYSFHMPYTDIGMFGLYAGTDAADASDLMRVIVDEIAGTAETITEPEVARVKAQMKVGLLMALESSGARDRAARAPDDHPRPASPGRGVGRKSRCGDRRKRPRRRPCPDRPRQDGNRRDRTWLRT